MFDSVQCFGKRLYSKRIPHEYRWVLLIETAQRLQHNEWDPIQPTSLLARAHLPHSSITHEGLNDAHRTTPICTVRFPVHLHKPPFKIKKNKTRAPTQIFLLQHIYRNRHLDLQTEAQNNSVGTVTTVWDGRTRNLNSIAGTARAVSRLQGVKTGFGTHTISDLTGSVVFFLGVRRPERQDDPPPESCDEVKDACSHTSIRNIRSYSVFKIL
jgi:hypothetical protein